MAGKLPGRKHSEPSLVGSLLIIGLGNPGPEYSANRHNVGFMIVEKLAGRYGIDLGKRRHRSRYGIGTIEGRRAILAEPLTYMNLSGEAVAKLMSYFRIEAVNLIILHDDLDMGVGKVRVKAGGGHGGHNGLRSVIETLKTGEFNRVKVGIGRPPAGRSAEGWVLQDFSADEEPVLFDGVEQAVEETISLIKAL